MDGYKDIHPWPYDWSLQPWPLAVGAWLDILDDYYELIDPWTYHNHWTHTKDDPADPYWPWVVDIYWAGTWPRSQVPPKTGDEMCDFIIQHMSDPIRLMIWFNRWWRPGWGWMRWDGPQGGFVDHVHIEFDTAKLTNPSG